MLRSLYFAVPLLLLLGILQSAVAPYFTIFGLVPQWLALVAIAWGLLNTPEEGVAWAFVAGVCSDLFSVGPFGVSAVAFIVGVFAVSLIQSGLPNSPVLLPIGLTAVATLIYAWVAFLLLRLFGYPIPATALASAVTLAVIHALLILPIYAALRALRNRFGQPRLLNDV